MKLIKFDFEGIKILDEVDMRKFISNFNIKVYREYDDITAPIILVYHSSFDDIKKRWIDIISECAFLFQSNIEEEFIRRNMILFFTSEEQVDLSTKNAIQKNTYCCRKIVLDCISDVENEIESYYLFGSKPNNQSSENTKLIDIIKKEHEHVYKEISCES